MKYETIFLSDIHLGKRGCMADLLLDFLHHHDANIIYLVGDIFDGWSLKRRLHWPESHSKVVKSLMEKARAGTKLVFIPGNHDELMRSFLGAQFGGIEVVDRAEFVTRNNRRFLVTHGDQFDKVLERAKWLAHVGDRAYDVTLRLNSVLNWASRRLGGRGWSFATWFKQMMRLIDKFEGMLANEARRCGFDGVICGHIHHANISKIGDIDYVNTGDWVESCTAIVEDPCGALRLIDWDAAVSSRNKADRKRRRKTDQSETPAEDLAA